MHFVFVSPDSQIHILKSMSGSLGIVTEVRRCTVEVYISLSLSTKTTCLERLFFTGTRGDHYWRGPPYHKQRNILSCQRVGSGKENQNNGWRNPFDHTPSKCAYLWADVIWAKLVETINRATVRVFCHWVDILGHEEDARGLGPARGQ